VKINILFLLCIFAYTSNLEKKHVRVLNKFSFCELLIREEFEKSLVKALDKKYAVESFDTSCKYISVSIILDSLANVVDARIGRHDCVNLKQVRKIEKDLIGKKLCLINPDPHLSFKEFLEIGENRYTYRLRYSFISLPKNKIKQNGSSKVGPHLENGNFYGK